MGQSNPRTSSGEAASTNRPAVTIISDVLLYREGLAASLVRDARLKILDLVAGANALPAISKNRPNVVLLDGAMANCLDLARRIRASMPDLLIVGFGISGGADRLVDCAESGLAAFVDSNGNVSELVASVFHALNGELACSPRVAALMCERLARRAAGSKTSANLTRREEEIAFLIGQGLSNKEIAKDLRIGPSTVKNHVHSILEKLNVPRRSAIVHQLSQSPWMRGAAAQLSSV